MVYRVILSAYGVSKQELENQVSVTNSIFNTELSVNTNDAYIRHCDNLSKLVDPGNRYQWTGRLHNITVLQTCLSHNNMLSYIKDLDQANLAYTDSICVPSGTIPYIALDTNSEGKWETSYYIRYPKSDCIYRRVLTKDNNGVKYMYDTDINILKNACFALNKYQISEMQCIGNFNICGDSGYSIQCLSNE